ncbi:e3 ubiquitin-protein ligase nrdp1-like [Stylonychia lemnae]|uniref:E3 ubiquitin-protein ligase nrdp1-like n=1 Tax=Stylonychia lemnae TaxID=5949 RepID=A0A078AKM5_STYLE|nr:e3 ubiquitin-protein ligase nrdp1-like [Stylonychia lemnae]|eukprot:CDW81997.1 e3 ubiquitin-protein ligase nrdp1-like [Stylonychia lemnae]
MEYDFDNKENIENIDMSNKLQKSQSFIPHENSSLLENSTKAESINFTSPIIKKRKTFIDRHQILNLDQLHINPKKIECKKCKGVMMHPLQCHGCHQNYCQNCYEVKILEDGRQFLECPKGCLNQNLQEPKYLQKNLAKFKNFIVNCQNKEKGCQSQMNLQELEKHLHSECQYENVMCSNFGCLEEMPRNQFGEHDKACQYKTIKCEKCETMIVNGTEHDCVISLRKRCELIEAKLLGLKDKMEVEKEKHKSEKIQKIQRFELILPQLKSIYFRPDFHVQSNSAFILQQDIRMIPKDTQALILRYTLTDLNVRRLIRSFQISQQDDNNVIELGNYFTIGTQSIPQIGMSTEILMPWDMSKSQTLKASITLHFHQNPNIFIPNVYQYASIVLAGVQKKFESFLQKQIEQLNNDAKNTHEQKALKNQNSKKTKDKPRRSHSREGHRKSMMVTDPQKKMDLSNQLNLVDDHSHDQNTRDNSLLIPITQKRRPSESNPSDDTNTRDPNDIKKIQKIAKQIQQHESAQLSDSEENKTPSKQKQINTTLEQPQQQETPVHPTNLNQMIQEQKQEIMEKRKSILVIEPVNLLQIREEQQDGKTNVKKVSQKLLETRQLQQQKIIQQTPPIKNKLNLQTAEDKQKEQISKRVLEHEQLIHKAVFSQESIPIGTQPSPKKRIDNESKKLHKRAQSISSVGAKDRDSNSVSDSDEEMLQKRDSIIDHQYNEIVNEYKQISQNVSKITKDVSGKEEIDYLIVEDSQSELENNE